MSAGCRQTFDALHSEASRLILFPVYILLIPIMLVLPHSEGSSDLAFFSFLPRSARHVSCLMNPITPEPGATCTHPPNMDLEPYLAYLRRAPPHALPSRPCSADATSIKKLLRCCLFLSPGFDSSRTLSGEEGNPDRQWLARPP